MSSLQTSPTSATVGFPDIALAGKAGAGKSTAADLLVELGYQKRSIATPLKDTAATLWGQEARADRDKLQKLGVAVREIDPNAWINLLVDALQAQRGNPLHDVITLNPMPEAPCVVDDLRFPNEYWALKAEGFVVVYVGAGLNRRVDRLKANGKWQDESQLQHVSETSLVAECADYIIDNDATKEDLYDALVDLLLRERRRR